MQNFGEKVAKIHQRRLNFENTTHFQRGIYPRAKLIVAAIKLMVFIKFSHFAKIFPIFVKFSHFAIRFVFAPFIFAKKCKISKKVCETRPKIFAKCFVAGNPIKFS